MCGAGMRIAKNTKVKKLSSHSAEYPTTALKARLIIISYVHGINTHIQAGDDGMSFCGRMKIDETMDYTIKSGQANVFDKDYNDFFANKYLYPYLRALIFLLIWG